MSDIYLGSVEYAAVAAWAATHAYNIGDIVRQLAAPSVGNERCFRCTTAGTSGGSEPAWNLGSGVTTVSGTATFTEVTGNATYNWSAPHARLATATARAAANAGDRVFVAHDHAETQASNITISEGSGSHAAPVKIICVNAAGSVPPVVADLRTTATVTTTGANDILIQSGVEYYYGINFVSGEWIRLGSSPGFAFCLLTFENCSFSFASTLFQVGTASSTKSIVVDLINTPIKFQASTGSIYVGGGHFRWRNTPNAVQGAAVPTVLFARTSGTSSAMAHRVDLDGLDLSAVNTTLFSGGNAMAGNFYANIVNCKLNASATTLGGTQSRGQELRLLGCSNTADMVRNEKTTVDGALTTEKTIVRTGGATYRSALFSWKIVTTAAPNRWNAPFESLPMAVMNTTTGSVVTATVEIVTDNVTLKDDEAWLELEYLSDASSPLASGVSEGPATPLTAGVNQDASTATWTTTGLVTPVKQKLVATFTAQEAGLVRAVVKIAKVSTTLYVDPKITLT